MSAPTFVQVLDAILGKRASIAARACAEDLARCDALDVANLPALRRVHASLSDDQTRGQGRLVIDVLKAPRKGLGTFVQLVAPGAVKPPHVEKFVLSLHADCWLALDKWIVRWNRRQIRRVA